MTTPIPQEYIIGQKYDGKTFVGYVTCGDLEFSSEDTAPNWRTVTLSYTQASFYYNECCLRVRAVFVE